MITRHGMLSVDNAHSVYWEDTGCSDATPFLILHGGPGTGLKESYKALFDPARCRLVGLDQRGAGRSLPLGETRQNNIQSLVADIERVRELLGIERWFVYGGSWGAALGLAYGQAYPERCLGFVLRSIFLARKVDTDWWFNGMRRFSPYAWLALVESLDVVVDQNHKSVNREQFCDAVLQGLANDKRSEAIAQFWRDYEKSCSSITLGKKADIADMDRLIAAVRIECHYFNNNCFLSENQLLNNMASIADKPAELIHGAYDLACPLDNAIDLHQCWLGSELTIIPGAGHTLSDPGMAESIRDRIHALLERAESAS